MVCCFIPALFGSTKMADTVNTQDVNSDYADFRKSRISMSSCGVDMLDNVLNATVSTIA